jgi:hypothetical protein
MLSDGSRIWDGCPVEFVLCRNRINGPFVLVPENALHLVCGLCICNGRNFPQFDTDHDLFPYNSLRFHQAFLVKIFLGINNGSREHQVRGRRQIERASYKQTTASSYQSSEIEAVVADESLHVLYSASELVSWYVKIETGGLHLCAIVVRH